MPTPAVRAALASDDAALAHSPREQRHAAAWTPATTTAAPQLADAPVRRERTRSGRGAAISARRNTSPMSSRRGEIDVNAAYSASRAARPRAAKESRHQATACTGPASARGRSDPGRVSESQRVWSACGRGSASGSSSARAALLHTHHEKPRQRRRVAAQLLRARPEALELTGRSDTWERARHSECQAHPSSGRAAAPPQKWRTAARARGARIMPSRRCGAATCAGSLRVDAPP